MTRLFWLACCLLCLSGCCRAVQITYNTPHDGAVTVTVCP